MGELIKFPPARGGNNNKEGKTEDKKDGPFNEFTKKIGPNFWAATFLRMSYERSVMPQELEDLKNLKEKVAKASLPEEEKRMLLDLLSTITFKEQDNWDFGETTTIIELYVVKRMITKEEFNYWLGALKAWREGKIREFAEREKASLQSEEQKEKELLQKLLDQKLIELLDVALTKDDLAVALALRSLFKYRFIMKNDPVGRKIEGVKNAIEIFRSMD
jgi:hypothetical protein